MFLSFVASLELLSERICFPNHRTTQRRQLQSLKSSQAWPSVLLLYLQCFRASSCCNLNGISVTLQLKTLLREISEAVWEEFVQLANQTDQTIVYSSSAEAWRFWINLCLTIYNWPLHKSTWNFYSLKPHLLTLLDCKILLFAINLYQDKQYIC